MKPSSSLLLAGSAVVLAVVGFVACSSDDGNKTGATGGDGGATSSSSSSGGAAKYTCTSKSKCANEPASTQEEINACNELLAGACAKEFQAYGDCSLAKEVCASDGTHDDDATKSACNDTWVPFSGCVTSKLADAGTDDGGSS